MYIVSERELVNAALCFFSVLAPFVAWASVGKENEFNE